MTGKKPFFLNHTHFLPDFCHSTFIFRLLLTTELIAFILFIIISSEDPQRWHWASFGLLSLFIQWITLISAAALCLLRTWLIRLPMTLCTFLCLVITLSIIIMTSLAAYHFPFLPAQLTPKSSISLVLLRNSIIGIIITAFLLRYAYVQYQLVQQQKIELQSRLQSLQSRIQPHFLFNSMNNIVSLIPTNPSLAETLIEDLSILLRASLSENSYEVPLSKEIDLAKRYLHLEKLRLNERLKIHWSLPKSSLDHIHVPHLLLQPLLENAIKHGIQPAINGGLIHITITQHDSHLHIFIKNTLSTHSTQASEGHHIGLRNIYERLNALYGKKGQMQTDKTITDYHVSIRIPV